MNAQIKYRIAARTEAAGKYDPSAPQEGNEDNYGLICDVATPERRTGFDEVTDLGKLGLLMFVADGMGGHSAGEVASKIAVDTVYDAFSEGKVSTATASNHRSRSRYLEETIREADKRICKYAKQNKECEGMGSTLIIAWLVDYELTVSWCGDSRAYLYHSVPSPSIEMVSEDHSYVQELVQRKVIPYEATFGHPRGNIVTRCLGGGGENAEPESRMAHVAKGDIVLLCSDGLSGVMFDDGRLFDGRPITEENICDTISTNRQQLRECCNALFAAAERQNWYDNVTVILCEAVDGPERKPCSRTSDNDVAQQASDPTDPIKNKRIVLFSIIGFSLFVVGALVGILIMRLWSGHNHSENDVVDSIHKQTVNSNQSMPIVEILEFTADKLVISGVGDYYIVQIDQHDTVIYDTLYRFNHRLQSGKHTVSVRSVCSQDTSNVAIKDTVFSHKPTSGHTDKQQDANNQKNIRGLVKE